MPIIGTACTVVYKMAWHQSVHLSQSPAAAAYGGFAAVGPASGSYRSTAAWPALQQHRAAARHAAANVCSVTLQLLYIGS